MAKTFHKSPLGVPKQIQDVYDVINQISGNVETTTKTIISSIGSGGTVLGNVTNDAQLKRAAADFNSFIEKTSPVNTDIILIEDSADFYNKKKVQLTNIPKNIDGGAAASIYLSSQHIDGGGA